MEWKRGGEGEGRGEGRIGEGKKGGEGRGWEGKEGSGVGKLRGQGR